MATITEKLARLRRLKQQTLEIQNEVANAKAAIAKQTYKFEYSTSDTLGGSNQMDDINTIVKNEILEPIHIKQEQANIALSRKQHGDNMIASIMANMPKIDYEAEAARLILRDGKQSLATAIANGDNRTRTVRNISNDIKRISVLDGPDDESDGEISDIMTDTDDYSSDIEIDESRYPHLDPIRTRPSTPVLDEISDQLTDDQVQTYVKHEYDRNIKIIKCWCIMANNIGYQLFTTPEINIIKENLASYQLLAIRNRHDMDVINWQGMFIQWLYVDNDINNGARCKFGRGWVLQYYPNYYKPGPPRIVVSTRYQPDFNNDRRTTAIYKSGYTQSVDLDGKTPIFRRIIAGDIAEALVTTTTITT